MSKIIGSFKIVEKVKDGGLAEIYQSCGTRMALLRTTDKADVLDKITAFVKCRDFLVDSYSYHKAKKNFKIYGFEFKAAAEELNYDQVRLLLDFSTAPEQSNFENHLKFIRDIETANNMSKTTIHKVDGKSNQIVMIGDARWLQNCLMFSFYTFLARLACYPVSASATNYRSWIAELGTQKTSDGKYVKSIAAGTWDKILTNLTLLETDDFCGFNPKEEEVHTIHHNSGMISVLGYHTEINEETVKKNPHWKLMQERGLETKVA